MTTNLCAVPGTYTQDWFTHHIPDWQELLAPYRHRPIRFLEIGTYEGLCARWLMDHILTHPEASLTVIDLFSGSEEHQELLKGQNLRDRFHANLHPHLAKIDLRQGSSEEELLQLQREILSHKISPKYDAIYVDGSHRPEDVLMDAWLSWPMLKKGGVLIFDDYLWEYTDSSTREAHRPARGIDKFLSMTRGEYVFLQIGWQIKIQKLY